MHPALDFDFAPVGCSPTHHPILFQNGMQPGQRRHPPHVVSLLFWISYCTRLLTLFWEDTDGEQIHEGQW